ncbi:hypothetical protein I6F30_33565, partial [Bradyrhizobium sp. NBAIM20]|uniref:hypothetical protein n=1 Tax=Bradyrhizobium sp. NBAIM20 TaxID=2793811 RepID=UPI001CD32913
DRNLSENQTGPKREAAFTRPSKERRKEDTGDLEHKKRDQPHIEEERVKLPERQKKKSLEKKRSR